MLYESFDKSEFVKTTQKLLSNNHLNRVLMNSLPYPAMLIRKDRRVITVNKVANEMGVEMGSFCWETFGKKASISEEDKSYYEMNNAVPSGGITCTFCMANEALASAIPINKKIPVGNITYDTFWVPITDDVYLHFIIQK
ncbi:MAG: hypothetical protein GY718_06490 [Lentisphaerae bacterium]|nr:hypothetical protein [Lentisphaerota bacterium]